MSTQWERDIAKLREDVDACMVKLKLKEEKKEEKKAKPKQE